MQEVGNQVLSDEEKSFYVMWKKTRDLRVVMLEDDCVGIWWSDTHGRYIFESLDRENKRTPRGLLKAL